MRHKLAAILAWFSLSASPPDLQRGEQAKTDAIAALAYGIVTAREVSEPEPKKSEPPPVPQLDAAKCLVVERAACAKCHKVSPEIRAAR